MAEHDEAPGLRQPIARRDVLHGLAGLAGAAAQDAGASYPPALTGLRGDHPGSFEAAHALRDGTLALPSIAPASEAYDLVVVGGGISGLATAVFYRDARPDARILILDN